MAKKQIKEKFKGKPHVQQGSPKTASPKKTKKQFDLYFWGSALLILLITFFVYFSSLSLHFVNWDDPNNLLDNETLKIFSYSWSWEGVKTIFTTDVIGNYNPLPILSFALEKYFFAPDPALNPFIFHFDNLWMHLVCTFFVFLIFTELGLSRVAVFAGALLFGIHPMRVESVAWITERKDVLYSMFFLSVLFVYLIYVKTNQKKWYWLAILLSVFSYFAKVQAVTLPLSMLALDFYLKRKWNTPKILVWEKLPWWILSLVFGLVNIHFLRKMNSIDLENNIVVHNFIDRMAVGAYSYAIYLVKWIYPYRLSPLYPYPPKLPVAAYIALVIVPLAIIGFLIWAIRKKKNDLLFGWAFFTFNIMFLLQMVGAGQGFLADRFTYIAYIGLFFIMIKGYDWAVQHKPAYKIFLQFAGGIYLSLFVYLTVNQIKIWQNGGTLWEHVKSIYPNSPLAWKQAAYYYRDEKKDFTNAILNYKQAIELDPETAYQYNGLAKVYIDKALGLDPKMIDFKQQQDELGQLAIQNYKQAMIKDSVAGKPDRSITAEININCGVAYAILGDRDRAIQYLSAGLDMNPDNINGYLNRSLLYFQGNQFELSLKDHDEYIKRNPYNPDMFHGRALCKVGLGKPAEAIPDFNKAISLKNTQPIYYLERSRAYRMMGKIGESVNDAKQAQRMGINVPENLLK